MSPTPAEYLLAGAPSEVERLQIEAQTWEPEVEAMLDEIGVQRGCRCLDLGCGSMGVLGPLARRTGHTGVVVGLDNDPVQLAAARLFVESQGFLNVELRQGDLFNVDLPAASNWCTRA